MLDVRRLRVLREVATQGSFSAAAESLSYTQSAVSQQIAALERETGTRLVERGPRGIRLTEAGRTLVDHADAVIARLSAAESELEAIAGLRGGRLRLATFQTAGATLVPRAIAEFIQRHPGVELSLTEADPEETIPRLKTGELDISMSFEYANFPAHGFDDLHEGIDLIPLLQDPMYVALPRDHALAGRARIRLRDLAEEEWIQGNCTGLCGAMHLAACQQAGFEPRLAYEVDDYNIAQGLVANGVAITLIPDLALTNLRDDIVIRPMGREGPVRKVFAAVAGGAFRSPATEAMLEILKDVAADYAAERRPLAKVS